MILITWKWNNYTSVCCWYWFKLTAFVTVHRTVDLGWNSLLPFVLSFFIARMDVLKCARRLLGNLIQQQKQQTNRGKKTQTILTKPDSCWWDGTFSNPLNCAVGAQISTRIQFAFASNSSSQSKIATKMLKVNSILWPV